MPQRRDHPPRLPGRGFGMRFDTFCLVGEMIATCIEQNGYKTRAFNCGEEHDRLFDARSPWGSDRPPGHHGGGIDTGVL